MVGKARNALGLCGVGRFTDFWLLAHSALPLWLGFLSLLGSLGSLSWANLAFWLTFWLGFYFARSARCHFERTFKDNSPKFVILSGVRKHKAKNPYFKVQSALQIFKFSLLRKLRRVDTSLTLSMTRQNDKQTLLSWLL